MTVEDLIDELKRYPLEYEVQLCPVEEGLPISDLGEDETRDIVFIYSE